MAGVRACQLAAAGVTGNDAILETKSGFDHLYRGDQPEEGDEDESNTDVEKPRTRSRADWTQLEGIGNPLVIMSRGWVFKTYPNCMSTHRSLDALRKLMDENHFAAGDVDKVTTFVGKVNMVNLKHPEPKDLREAQFSMQYAIAVMLRFGAVRLKHFTPRAVADEETRRLMRRVEMKPSSGGAKGAVDTVRPHKVVVHLKNGTELTAEVLHPSGSKNQPFTSKQREEKFFECARGILPQEQLHQVFSILSSPAGKKLKPLMDALRFEAAVDDGTRFIR